MSRAVLVFTVLPILGLVVACSSSTSTSGSVTPTDPAALADGGPTTPDDAGTESPDGGDAAAATDPDQVCGAATTMKACVACCDGNHADTTYADALLACTCDLHDPSTTTFCYTNCKATACSAVPKAPSEPCGRCQQGSVVPGGSCAAYVTKACAGKADCTAHQACVATCSGKYWQ